MGVVREKGKCEKGRSMKEGRGGREGRLTLRTMSWVARTCSCISSASSMSLSMVALSVRCM